MPNSTTTTLNPSPPLGGQRPIIAIAASTSGPQALRKLLSSLPPDFPAPVMVAQHLTDGFAKGLAQWLDTHVPLHVQVAHPNTVPMAGNVYLAPDGCHIAIEKGRIITPKAKPSDAQRPSADLLFRSIADTYGPLAIGIVLTGMGKDGAEGAVAIKQAGGRVIVQDLEDAAVAGMPKAVIARKAYDIILPLGSIGPYLSLLVSRFTPWRKIKDA